MRRARRVTMAALVGALMFAPGATVGAKVTSIDLKECGLTVLFMKVDAPHAQALEDRYLPRGYTRAEFYGPGTASVAPWTFGCEQVQIDGSPVGPAVVSFIAIQINDRSKVDLAPTDWDHYVVWLHTNNRPLARALRAAGQPARHVPGMDFVWSGEAGDHTTRAHVPLGGSPYGLYVHAMEGTDTPHAHDNTFQHGPPGRARSIVRLMMEFPIHDLGCGPRLTPGCASISTKPGTSIADFFEHAEVVIAADHTGPLRAAPHRIPHAILEVSTG